MLRTVAVIDVKRINFSTKSYQNLINEIETGVPRYRAPNFWPKIAARLHALDGRLSMEAKLYASALYGYKSGTCSIDDVNERLRSILKLRRVSRRTELRVNALLATLTFKRVSRLVNFRYRERAIALARELRDPEYEIVLKTNRVFALLSLDQPKAAETHLREVEAQLDTLPSKIARRPKVLVAKARILGHRAKVQLAYAAKRRDLDCLRRGNSLYAQAIDAVREIEHDRVNLLIEWANRIADVLVETRHPGLILVAEEKLNLAHRGLDAHDCKLCEAYFSFVKAMVCYFHARERYNSDREHAIRLWEESVQSAETSIEAYKTIGHQLVREPETMKTNASAKIAVSKQPSAVFLSHKTHDKPKVKRFESVLRSLGFEPWIDEHSIPAGGALPRKIQEGMRASCACVFFITEQFRDEKYLAFEIDLAKAIQIERGADRFAIIPLVFGGHVEVPQMIKDLGKYVVIDHELDALAEILRWLPVKVGSVYSPDLLKEDWSRIV